MVSHRAVNALLTLNIQGGRPLSTSWWAPAVEGAVMGNGPP